MKQLKISKWYDESYEYVSDEFKETVYSESDCYIVTLHRNGIAIADMTEGDCYFYTVDELEVICREHNLEVVIVS